jgi:hypothetical protein
MKRAFWKVYSPAWELRVRPDDLNLRSIARELEAERGICVVLGGRGDGDLSVDSGEGDVLWELDHGIVGNRAGCLRR